MAQRKYQIAIDFAVLIKGMCTQDFFPNFDNVFVDVDTTLPEKEWTRIYQEKSMSEYGKIIQGNALGKYLLDLGYSVSEVFGFFVQVDGIEMANALKILFGDQL
jgi:hypothetical protein